MHQPLLVRCLMFVSQNCNFSNAFFFYCFQHVYWWLSPVSALYALVQFSSFHPTYLTTNQLCRMYLPNSYAAKFAVTNLYTCLSNWLSIDCIAFSIVLFFFLVWLKTYLTSYSYNNLTKKTIKYDPCDSFFCQQKKKKKKKTLGCLKEYTYLTTMYHYNFASA